MTGAALLIVVGGMVVLAGLVLLVASLLGVTVASRRPTPRARVVVRPAWIAAGLAGVLTLLLTGWVPLAAGAAGLVLIAPSIFRSSGADRQIVRLEALSSWIRRLADLLASGAAGSLESALQVSARTAPSAIADEVALLGSRLGPHGSRAALLGFAHDIGDPAADQVVMALILHLRHGGQGLARVLSGLADDLSEQTRTRRAIEADRAKPRTNARVLALLPLVLTAGEVVFAHGFLEPYGSAEGQLALAVVVALFGIALLWLRAMIRQPAGDRLLVQDDFTDVGAIR